MVTKRTRYAPSRRKRTTPRDELLPLPFARVSPDTPGAWGQTERGNNQPPVAGVIVDEPTLQRDDARLQQTIADASALRDTQATVHVTIELDGLDVACVRHPDRPTWFVVVWPEGARERARAAGRGPEGDVLAQAVYVVGRELWWRRDPKLDDSARAIVAHAVVRAVDAHTDGAT